MEPLFSTTCEHTKSNYQDALSAIIKREKIVASAISVFLCASSLYCAITFNQYLFLSFFAAFILLPLNRYGYQIDHAAKIFAERNNLMYHQTVVQEIYFFDDHIKTISCPSNGETFPSYADITQVVRSKKLYILLLGKVSFIPLDKTKFVNITIEEFERFIREKAVNAKVFL